MVGVAASAARPTGAGDDGRRGLPDGAAANHWRRRRRAIDAEGGGGGAVGEWREGVVRCVARCNGHARLDDV